MFWGSFTAKGPGRLNIIAGMMNSDKHKATLQSHLLPVLKRNLFVCGYPSSFTGWRYSMNGNSGSCRQPN